MVVLDNMFSKAQLLELFVEQEINMMLFGLRAANIRALHDLILDRRGRISSAAKAYKIDDLHDEVLLKLIQVACDLETDTPKEQRPDLHNKAWVQRRHYKYMDMAWVYTPSEVVCVLLEGLLQRHTGAGLGDNLYEGTYPKTLTYYMQRVIHTSADGSYDNLSAIQQACINWYIFLSVLMKDKSLCCSIVVAAGISTESCGPVICNYTWDDETFINRSFVGSKRAVATCNNVVILPMVKFDTGSYAPMDMICTVWSDLALADDLCCSRALLQ